MTSKCLHGPSSFAPAFQPHAPKRDRLPRESMRFASGAAPAGHGPAPLPPLTSEQILEVAAKWRARAMERDPRAEIVVRTLEWLAAHRGPKPRKTRLRRVGERISKWVRLELVRAAVETATAPRHLRQGRSSVSQVRGRPV